MLVSVRGTGTRQVQSSTPAVERGGWRHTRGSCCFYALATKTLPSPITNPYRVTSEALWLPRTSWMNLEVPHSAENPEESFISARMLESQKLAKALCQCRGGIKTLVKSCWVLPTAVMLREQFGNVCRGRKRIFLLVLLHASHCKNSSEMDVVACVGNEVQ